MHNGNGARTIIRDMMLLPSDKAKIDYLVQRIGSRNIKVAEMERKIIEIGTMIDSLPQNAKQADFQVLMGKIKKLIGELNILPAKIDAKPAIQAIDQQQTATT